MADRRRAIALVVVAAFVQLVIAAIVPLDPDESYYWDWSRHLAAGYFDHPPMVAFFIKLGVVLFGATPLGVRFCSIAGNLGATLLLLAIARRHGGERAAWRAACIITALPVLTGWLLLAMPDPAFYLFSMATLYAVDVALAAPSRSMISLRWWLAAGIALGLTLVSKYVAVLIPAGIVVAFLSHRELRRRFAEPGPWVACAVAALIFTPVVIWNAQHNWVSFRFQLQHGLGAGRSGSLQRILDYVTGQAGFATPILFALMFVAVVGSARLSSDGRKHLLALVAAFSFLWFLVSAARQPVEANWPLMAYPAAAIVLAAAPSSRWRDRWFIAGVGVGWALGALIYLQMLVRVVPFPPDNDPVRRGHGWDDVAVPVAAAMRAASGSATWVAANRYQDASELAFNLPDHPAVFSLNYRNRPNQYDLWARFPERASRCDNLVLVVDEAADHGIANTFGAHFESMHEGELVSPGGTAPLLTPKRIWTLTCWKGSWPA